MSSENEDFIAPGTDTTSAEDGIRPARRKIMIAGALLVPTIVTLHGTPAWAQTDYTVTAYRYGDNAGKCKNPNYNPNANENSQASQEFIDCQTGRTHEDDSGEGQQDSGPVVF